MAAFSSIALGVGAAAATASAVGGIVAGNNAADAATSASDAQLKASREQVKSSQDMFDKNMAERHRMEGVGREVGEMTATELASINRLLQTKELGLTKSFEALAQEQKVLDDIDPVIKESGKQTLEMLKGKTSEYLKPVLDQRTRQRQQLEEQLSRRLGPGFRTSSAGIEALSKFDTATNEVTMQVQQSAFKDVSATFFTSVGLRPKNMVANVNDIFGRAAAIDNSVAQIAQNQASRKASSVINAVNGTPVNYGAVPAAYGSVVDAAKSVGDAGRIQASSMADLFSNVGQIGGNFMGMGLGKLFGGSGGGGGGLSLEQANLTSSINNYKLPF